MSTEDNTRVSADGDRPVIGVSWKWFALLCLTGGYGDDRLELLVVPPDTPAAVAARAMTLAAGRGNRFTATDTLRAARILPGVVAGVVSAVPRPRHADSETDSTDAGES